LTVIPYIKNIGGSDITQDLGFAWRLTDIKIDNTYENDYIKIWNNTGYPNYPITTSLAGDLNVNYTNLNQTKFEMIDDGEYLRLNWNESLNYKLMIDSNPNQYNAPTTLAINAGTLAVGEEKHTTMYWIDAISNVSVSSGTTGDLWDDVLTWNHDFACGDDIVLIVGVGVDNPDSGKYVASITYDEVPLTKLAETRSSDDQVGVEMWNLSNPPCGSSLPIVVTYSEDSTEEAAGISTVYYGVDYIDNTTMELFQSAGADTSVLGITTTSTDEVVVDMFAVDKIDGAIPYNGDNQNQRGTVDQGDVSIYTSDAYDSDLTTNIGWEISGDGREEIVHIAVALIPNEPPTVALNSPANESEISDTTPDLVFTGIDAEEDEIEYQIQVDTSDTFSFPEDSASGGTTTLALGDRIGQTFTATHNSNLTEVDLYLKGTGIGDFYVKLYEMIGTYGIDGKPTGSPIATSDVYVVSLTDSVQKITFSFSGINQYQLSSGEHYVIVGDSSGLSSGYAAFQGSTTGIHDGNLVYSSDGSTWSTKSSYDLNFAVRSDYNYTKFSITDSGFTVGHPFASGEQVTYTVQDALSLDTYYWRVRGTSPLGTNIGDWSEIRQFTITEEEEDNIPPTYSNTHQTTTNNTNVSVGQSITFGTQWNDETALSMYVNSTSINSSAFTNGTWQSFSAGNWSNFTISYPSNAEGGNITFKIFANDTSNNMAETGIWIWRNETVEAPPEDTCNPTSPLSADYTFDCNDNCSQDAPLNANGYNINWEGAGNYYLEANIENVRNMTIANACNFYKGNGNITIMDN